MPLPTIKHYGFDWPPVGLTTVLQQLPLTQHCRFYILDPFTGSELPYPEIEITSKENLFVIIYTHEGASHHWFDRLILKLLACGMPAKQIILYSSCLLDPETPITHIGSIMQYASAMIDQSQNCAEPQAHKSTHHFVCLNRVHRWQRLALVKQLIDRDLLQWGRVSYTHSIALSNDPYHHHFPLIVDYANPTYDQGHELHNPALTGAALNVICESCYERQSECAVFESHPLPGLTEKTFKSIFLSQIPIWLAPQGTVHLYKNLGFDAFDDVIDHAYDQESDPEKRMYMVADQIELFCRRDIQDVRDLMQDLRLRCRDNWFHLRSFYHNWDKEIPKWFSVFDAFGLVDHKI